MRLDGIHHITAITGDAPGNVDFYTRVLGLRLVKKTVNQDDPSIYHLFYADEQGDPGLGPDVLRVSRARGAGARAPGMVHRVVWRVGLRARRSTSGQAAARRPTGVATRRATTAALLFADPEGLDARAARRRRRRDPPLDRRAPRDPGRARAAGLRRACARTPRDPERSRASARGDARVRADGRRLGGCAATRRGGFVSPTTSRRPSRGIDGAGTRPPRRVGVHGPTSSRRWRERLAARGRARHAADRPLLLPVASTSASRAACSSRSRRWAPASPSTRTPPTSASGSRCRRPSSTCATRSSAR